MELASDGVEEPGLALVAPEDDVIAPVGRGVGQPRVKGPLGVVQHDGVGDEGEGEPGIGKPVGQLDVLGAPERRIEAAGGLEVAAARREAFAV